MLRARRGPLALDYLPDGSRRQSEDLGVYLCFTVSVCLTYLALISGKKHSVVIRMNFEARFHGFIHQPNQLHTNKMYVNIKIKFKLFKHLC